MPKSNSDDQLILYCPCLGFPGGSDGKESARSVGDPGSISGSGRSPGEGTGNLLQYACLGNPIGLTADLSIETLQARRGWQDIFKVLTGKNLQQRLLYPARISLKIYGEIKSFIDKQKLKNHLAPPNQLYNTC